MANLTNMTALGLATRYNELTGKSLKPSSYSKAKFIELIEAAGADAFRQKAKEVMKVKKEAREELAKIKQIEDDHSFGFTHCPHCGVHHSNGFCTNEDITDQGGEPNKTHEYVCLGCGGEFGPELGSTFTLTEAAASIGVKPKVARARYRMLDNDGKRTRYEFPRSDWDRVISLISPKRKAR